MNLIPMSEHFSSQIRTQLMHFYGNMAIGAFYSDLVAQAMRKIFYNKLLPSSIKQRKKGR